MSFWLTLALQVVSFIATALLAPKPQIESAKPARLGDFRFPQSDEGSPVPIFWGRVRMRGPNTMWYGNLQAVPIRETIRTSPFTKKSIIVGYRYFLTLDMALGLLTGNGSRLRRIWFGEKVAWEGDVGFGATDGVDFMISAPTLFGGPKNGGGVEGTATFYPGTFTQTIDTHLQGLVPDGTLLPAYRGLARVVFKDFFIGEQPSVPAVSFEVESQPGFLGLGGVGPNGDANPAEILADVVLNNWGRLGFSSGSINSDSFVSAGGTLLGENHGMSLRLENANDARDFVQEVLQQIDGLIYEDPFTREIHLVLIRDDYVAEGLPLFDQSNVRDVTNYSVSQWQDTFNQVRVVYTDRSSNYKDKTAFAQDASNIEFQGGRVRGTDFQYPGISNADLANRIVAREINLISIPLIKARLSMNRDGAQLRPGDVIRWSWPEYGLQEIVMRVQGFDLGTLDDNRVVVDVVQDRFAVSSTVFAEPPTTDWVAPQVDAQDVTIRRTLELPRYLGAQLIENSAETEGTDPDESYLQYLALAPSALHTAFEAQASIDAGTEYLTDVESAPFTASALLSAAVVLETNEQIAGASPFILGSVSDTSALTGAAVTPADVRLGANLIMVNDELIAFQSATDNMDGTYTLNDVSRGLIDTSARAHALGDRVWFLGFVDLDNFGSTNFLGDETVRNRLLSTTGFNVLAESQATTSDVVLTARPRRPLPVDNLTVDGALHPTADVPQVAPLAWNRRDRLADQIALPLDADQTPEVGTTYEARWTLDGGAVQTQALGSVSSINVDFGGAGNVALEVVSLLGGRESFVSPQRSFTTVPVQAGPGIAGIESATDPGGGASLTINAPAGIASGDFLLLLLHDDNQGTALGWPTPAGWTFVRREGNGTSDSSITVFSRVADGTEGADVTINHNFPGLVKAGFYVRVTNCQGIGFQGAVTTVNNNNVDAVSLNTTAANSLVLATAAVDGGDAIDFVITPGSFEKQAQVFQGAAVGVSAVFATRLVGIAGASGNCNIAYFTGDGSVAFQMELLEA